jgi:hypothetical protein
MADVANHASSFGELRAAVMSQLMDARASLDPGLAQLDSDAAQAQLAAVLDQVQAHLATGDREPLRAFLRSFLTMRAAQSLSPDTLLQAVVAIGDTCVQVVQQRGGPAASELACALTRTGAVCTRLVVEHIADELERRTRQRDDLAAEGTP